MKGEEGGRYPAVCLCMDGLASYVGDQQTQSTTEQPRHTHLGLVTSNRARTDDGPNR